MTYLLSKSTYELTITHDPDVLDEDPISSNESLEFENEIDFTEEVIAEATEFFKENYYRQWEALQESESDLDDDEDEPWPLPSFATLLTLIDEDFEDDWIDDDECSVLLEVLDEIMESNHQYIETPKYVIKVNICKFGSYDEENDEWILSLEYSIHQYPDDSTG